jgi:hypothetical protein
LLPERERNVEHVLTLRDPGRLAQGHSLLPKEAVEQRAPLAREFIESPGRPNRAALVDDSLLVDGA